jgi:hypothetical protein
MRDLFVVISAHHSHTHTHTYMYICAGAAQSRPMCRDFGASFTQEGRSLRVPYTEKCRYGCCRGIVAQVSSKDDMLLHVCTCICVCVEALLRK